MLDTERWIQDSLNLESVLVDLDNDNRQFRGYCDKVNRHTRFGECDNYVGHSVEQLFFISSGKLKKVNDGSTHIEIRGDDSTIFALLAGRALYNDKGLKVDHIFLPRLVYISMKQSENCDTTYSTYTNMKRNCECDRVVAKDYTDSDTESIITSTTAREERNHGHVDVCNQATMKLDQAAQDWTRRSCVELMNKVTQIGRHQRIFFVIDDADELIDNYAYYKGLFKSLDDADVPVILCRKKFSIPQESPNQIQVLRLIPLTLSDVKRSLESTAVGLTCFLCNRNAPQSYSEFLERGRTYDAYYSNAMATLLDVPCSHSLVVRAFELLNQVFDLNITSDDFVLFLYYRTGGYRSNINEYMLKFIYRLEGRYLYTMHQTKHNLRRGHTDSDFVRPILTRNKLMALAISDLSAASPSSLFDIRISVNPYSDKILQKTILEVLQSRTSLLSTSQRLNTIHTMDLPQLVGIIDTKTVYTPLDQAHLTYRRNIDNIRSTTKTEQRENNVTSFNRYKIIPPLQTTWNSSVSRDLSDCVIYKFDNMLNDIIWNRTMLAPGDGLQIAVIGEQTVPYLIQYMLQNELLIKGSGISIQLQALYSSLYACCYSYITGFHLGAVMRILISIISNSSDNVLWRSPEPLSFKIMCGFNIVSADSVRLRATSRTIYKSSSVLVTTHNDLYDSAFTSWLASLVSATDPNHVSIVIPNRSTSIYVTRDSITFLLTVVEAHKVVLETYNTQSTHLLTEFII